MGWPGALRAVLVYRYIPAVDTRTVWLPDCVCNQHLTYYEYPLGRYLPYRTLPARPREAGARPAVRNIHYVCTYVYRVRHSQSCTRTNS